MDLPDSDYKLLMTDIYGSSNATGILVDLDGMVVGILDHDNKSSDMPNLLTAYGITELKKTIEKMSNNKERGYLGVYGCDVPQEVAEDTEIQIPAGAYIKTIEMDSPAMAAGIQSGDVITRAGDAEIATYNELLQVLDDLQPEDVLTLTLSRQGREMQVEVTLGE